MIEVWSVGVFISWIICVVALVVSIIAYIDLFDEGRRVRRPAARCVVASTFVGPLVAFVWPLAVIGLAGFGMYFVVRDALPEKTGYRR